MYSAEKVINKEQWTKMTGLIIFQNVFLAVFKAVLPTQLWLLHHNTRISIRAACLNGVCRFGCQVWRPTGRLVGSNDVSHPFRTEGPNSDIQPIPLPSLSRTFPLPLRPPTLPVDPEGFACWYSLFAPAVTSQAFY